MERGRRLPPRRPISPRNPTRPTVSHHQTLLLPRRFAGPGIVGVIMVGFFATDELTSNAYGYEYGEYRDKGNKEDYIGVFFGGNAAG